MIKLTLKEIEKRVPVWEAMSELFLDTELQDNQYRYIARVLQESGYSAKEMNHILWLEVCPAVGDNLSSLAGDWTGFNAIWLKERILRVMMMKEKPYSKLGVITVSAMLQIIHEEWLQVCRYLSKEHVRMAEKSILKQRYG